MKHQEQKFAKILKLFQICDINKIVKSEELDKKAPSEKPTLKIQNNKKILKCLVLLDS